MSNPTIADRSDIVVDRPISRKTIRETESGYLSTCNVQGCEWQGLFPDADLAAEAADRHYDHEVRNGTYHQGTRTWTVVELIDSETACTLDESKLGLSVEELRYRSADGSVREWPFPRTTGDVSALVERGDKIIVPADREQKVRTVRTMRSHGLPAWTVGYCDLDDDLTAGNRHDRAAREVVARDGQVYYSFGEAPLKSPAFKIIGRADHQADISQFSGGAKADD